MNGQLSEHPLAELIREIAATNQTGGLRLERERVKVVIYFAAGAVVYATSNLRTHRLGEVVKRSNALTALQMAPLDQKPDAELAEVLLSERLLSRASLTNLRLQQVSGVLRAALLWIDGQWAFDGRVRLAEQMRLEFDTRPLLMECARRLPRGFVMTRFRGMDQIFSPCEGIDKGVGLLPAEAFLLSRVDSPMSLNDLKALSGLREAEALRVAYALSLGGYLNRSKWPIALTTDAATAPDNAGEGAASSSPGASAEDGSLVRDQEQRALASMLERVNRADNHYDVLDVGRATSMTEIKRAYHQLARSFHPDKFHKSVAPKVYSQLEAAFARFSLAYETLSNLALRSAYDARLTAEETSGPGRNAALSNVGRSRSGPSAKTSKNAPGASADQSRAEMSFRQGLAALQEDKRTIALRCFAEAAQLAPTEARYRAYYGNTLMSQPQSRRLAESELQAAISLDPRNATYHVMLARLCRELGFSRRAQTALEKALTLEPGNESARQLLRTLQ